MKKGNFPATRFAATQNLLFQPICEPEATAGRQFGYTLLELVVAVGILGALAVAATSLFFSAIRGGGKVDVTTEVKQNGQFALSRIEQLTRNSLTVEACAINQVDPEAVSVTLTARDRTQLTFSCEVDAEGNGYIASNTERLTSDRVNVTYCAFWCEGVGDSFRPPLVKAAFTLSQAGRTGDVTEAATAQFSTSVGLRSF
ncbi:MAG: type II secretion system protein [Candidatus Chisholmbacteria bacterium]|nr:type II secretion system protein [Candidatus Chisholmbacteria bacterium]